MFEKKNVCSNITILKENTLCMSNIDNGTSVAFLNIPDIKR